MEHAGGFDAVFRQIRGAETPTYAAACDAMLRLQVEEHVLQREVPPQVEDVVLTTAQYQMPNLKNVDLSWAGRLPVDHRSLQAIAEAQVGDPVRLVNEGEAWLIHDAHGRSLGRMARTWSPPEGLIFLRGEVGAVVLWRKADNKEEFRAHLRRDAWEAICPKLVYG